MPAILITGIIAAAGAVAGASGGIMKGRSQKKAQKKAEKEQKRERKMAAVHHMGDTIRTSQAMRQRALVALGQAHMNYASMA